MTHAFCCEVCDRYRSCGNDCGSCVEVETNVEFQEAMTRLIETLEPIAVVLVSAKDKETP